MSKAEELLMSLSESVNEHGHYVVDSETHFVIDPVTREIDSSPHLDKAIMQYDHASERFTFELPRYVEGHDMTLCNRVRVHYINIDGETGESNSEPVELYDLRVDPENPTAVICSWVVTRNATQLAGTLNFLVQYMCVSDMGVVDYEFHSNIYRDLPVKKNERTDEAAVIEYTDIIEQWRAKLFGAGDSAVADITLNAETQLKNIETEGAEQVAAVVETKDNALAEIIAKGETTLASIPEDYTTTHNMADAATRTKASAIVVTAEGETIVAEDCSDDYLRGLHVYGKTTQVATTGKQLLQNKASDYSSRGVNFKSNSDGSVTIRGTATGNDAFYLVDFRNDIPKVDTELIASISGNDKISMVVGYFTSEDEFVNDIASVTDSTTAVFKYPTDAVATRTFIAVPVGVSVDAVVYPMVRLASVADDTYEPYSGGVASPSPEWSQDLNSVIDPLIGLYGKNLIDVHSMELASNKSVTISPDDYTVTAVGGSDNTYAYSHYDIPSELVQLLRGRTLRLSSDSISKSVSSAYSPVQLNVKCSDGTFQYPVNHDTKLYHEFTLPDDAVEIRFGVYTNNSSTMLESDNTVVVTGVRLTLAEHKEYEPYKGYQTLPLNRTLPGIPVESGGNYTDSNGQQWIADEIDFERGVYIQRVAHHVFDGSADEAWSAYDSFNGAYMLSDLDRGIDQYATPMFCNYALRKSWGTGSQDKHYCFINGYDDFVIGGSEIKNLYPTLNSWKAQIATTPCEVIYVLATPIETPLTEEELLAFSKLHSNSLVTTALNSENAYMGLVYNADTKAYLEGYVKEILNTLVKE